ncbi:MAG TPA: hypothetical protein VLD62_06760, partial [Acidimicrobiia bacterium]|nr:hypothetical protein [Acidimicrobiia bacterium]
MSMLAVAFPRFDALGVDPQIRSNTHEGQQNPAGTWTTGNTSEFEEGGWVNFRVNLAADAALTGQMSVKFSKEDSTCSFFEQAFALGNLPYGGGPVQWEDPQPVGGTTATILVTPVGGVQDPGGTEYVQDIDIKT